VRETVEPGVSVGEVRTILPPGRSLKAQHGGHFAVLASVAGDRGAPQESPPRLDGSSVAPLCRRIASAAVFGGRTVTMVKPGFIDTALTGGISPPLLAGAGAMRPGRPRGNPPQNSNRLCPVLVEGRS